MIANPLAGRPDAAGHAADPPARASRRHWLKAGAAALLANALPGCSMFGSKVPAITAPAMPTAPALPTLQVPAVPALPTPVLPTVIAGTVSAAANLNPSVSQRPSPVVIRLYELRALTDFAKADFMALYQSDVATLGSGLVLRDEFTLQPGESRPYQRTLAPETRFVAVFAAYRDVERATWRASAPVQPGRKQTVLLHADSLALSLTIQP